MVRLVNIDLARAPDEWIRENDELARKVLMGSSARDAVSLLDHYVSAVTDMYFTHEMDGENDQYILLHNVQGRVYGVATNRVYEIIFDTFEDSWPVIHVWGQVRDLNIQIEWETKHEYAPRRLDVIDGSFFREMVDELRKINADDDLWSPPEGWGDD